LDADKGWRPSITVKQVLLGIQDLLDTPNASDPANGEAYDLYMKSKVAYTNKVKQIAAANTPS
jgi:ubiquitin-conjugating enzyme E2 I